MLTGNLATGRGGSVAEGGTLDDCTVILGNTRSIDGNGDGKVSRSWSMGAEGVQQVTDTDLGQKAMFHRVVLQ